MQKAHPKKVIFAKTFAHNNKSENFHFSVIFVDKYAWGFSNFFNRFEISIKSAFSDTHIAFLKKNLHFLQTLKSNADETAKKTENFFINVSYKL